MKKELEESIFESYQRKLTDLNNLNELENLKLVFHNLISSLINLNQLELIIYKLNEYNFVNNSLSNKLIEVYLNQMKFINKLSSSDKVKFSFDSLKDFILNQLKNLLTELKKLSENNYSYDDINGNLIFKGHFSSINFIIQFIEYYNENEDIKNITIFNTHLVVFEQDVKLYKIFYKTHAPDIIIFSPKVIISKKVTVDLTCERKPGFPDNQETASEVYGDGANGKDGKPGLPGFNGGSLVIIADVIHNSTNLEFISNGGEGGQGQCG